MYVLVHSFIVTSINDVLYRIIVDIVFAEGVNVVKFPLTFSFAVESVFLDSVFNFFYSEINLARVPLHLLLDLSSENSLNLKF